MANTTSGWPYPVGTDKVRDGDNAIKAVADLLELRLRAGAVRYGRVDTTIGANGRAKVAFSDITVVSCVVTPGAPAKIMLTLTNTEGAVAGQQRSAALFQVTDHAGVDFISGQAVAFYYIAIGTYVGPA